MFQHQHSLALNIALNRLFVENCCGFVSASVLSADGQIRFPYLLPNVFGAVLSPIGLASVYMLLEETHHGKNNGGR